MRQSCPLRLEKLSNKVFIMKPVMKLTRVEHLSCARHAFQHSTSRGVMGPTTGGSAWRFLPGTAQGLVPLRCFSRADREIGVFRHVGPPTGLVSNFLVRPASS